jgi:alpha 1,6-mannosyltransferase
MPPSRTDPTFKDAVLNLTGPGLFTDAVFWYLESRLGVTMQDLQGLDEPRLIGDILILPQTAFSPEMTHIHSYSNSHPNSLVKHMFSGSWKSAWRLTFFWERFVLIFNTMMYK